MARNGLCGAILAAGHGTITPGKSKLLEPLNNGCTIIEAIVHLLDQRIDISRLAVVINHVYGDSLQGIIDKSFPSVTYAHQPERRGTADAARLSVEALRQEYPSEQFNTILILYGDMPLWRPESLALLIDGHRRHGATISMFSINISNLNGGETASKFGRILRDAKGQIIGVKEPQQMTPEDVQLWSRCRRTNPSAWVLDINWLMQNVIFLEPHDKKDGFPSEIWLPDLVKIAVSKNRYIWELELADPREALGVNTEYDLLIAQALFQKMHCQR
ncbi:hypothetical protein A3D54_01290 [Candidatus Falkowbacteria bacterium RIFCSPHIGHO2_02_FULL_45_15]|uniref:MobA-like NTP transferase domain-containing protein n=1 Tax=Candidatus Falkowbacteria bacterium RIFCSPHIGHO2_02_FULL_45_15 TaxID=1797987 RepID=A0A1F5RL73_9BACT|nr:MAG: hypothetical protein A3D54_01290 [Candidatus Falkowbacteria bacterium RIFCSPHIGHO2_02_FULL_45_15]